MNFYLACVLFLLLSTSSSDRSKLVWFFFSLALSVQFFFVGKKVLLVIYLNGSKTGDGTHQMRNTRFCEKWKDIGRWFFHSIARSGTHKAHAVNEYFVAINYLFNVIGCWKTDHNFFSALWIFCLNTDSDLNFAEFWHSFFSSSLCTGARFQKTNPPKWKEKETKSLDLI